MATTYLYRLWNEAGDLLYIGISKRLMTRLIEHDAQQPWAHEVAKITAAKYSSRDAARAAEKEAINSENPRYNIKDRGKPDFIGMSEEIWQGLSEPERIEMVAAMQRFVAHWPEDWKGDIDRRIRGNMSAAAALMGRGMSPKEAVNTLYPERVAQ